MDSGMGAFILPSFGSCLEKMSNCGQFREVALFSASLHNPPLNSLGFCLVTYKQNTQHKTLTSKWHRYGEDAQDPPEKPEMTFCYAWNQMRHFQDWVSLRTKCKAQTMLLSLLTNELEQNTEFQCWSLKNRSLRKPQICLSELHWAICTDTHFTWYDKCAVPQKCQVFTVANNQNEHLFL